MRKSFNHLVNQQVLNMRQLKIFLSHCQKLLKSGILCS